MAISLDNETKTKVSLNKEAKNGDMTWDSSYPATWDDMDSAWDAPKFTMTKETKTKVSLNNESK